MHVAALSGQSSIIKHLVTKYGADVDAFDEEGNTPLHWAASIIQKFLRKSDLI
jgi:ankyrin repeat protein